MAYKDLGEFIEKLRHEKDLAEIEEEMDPKFEMAALLKEVGSKDNPAILFKKVRNHQIPVIGNLLGARKRLALALGVSEEKMRDEYLKRLKILVPPRIVEDGPIKEVVIKDEIDLCQMLPILTYHERDVNPYISVGIAIAKDDETKMRSMGIHRIEIKGENRMGIFLATPPLSQFYRKAEEKGKSMDIAIALGVDPLLLLSSVVWAPTGPDKFEIAGGLRGEPVELIKGETVDIEVPAQAEIVIEGKVLPEVREKEGPFGESSGYYLTYNNPVIEVTAITRRRNPICLALMPWTFDEEMLIEVAFGYIAYQEISKTVPYVKNLHLFSGTCAAHAVISLENPNPGEVKKAIISTLNANPQIKWVVAVDEDVDIYDFREVEWAIATRFQADKDLIVIPGLEGSSIDPSTGENYLTAKVGIDATRPSKEEKFDKIKVHPASKSKAEEIWNKYK